MKNNEVKYLLRRITLAYYNFRYSHYYTIVMPMLIISAGLLVFVVIILPQLQNWFSIRSEVEATQRRIDTMRSNMRLLQNMNRFNLENDFTTATQALPGDKDFAGILYAIGQAASVSNVSLHDYEFTLGAVSLNKGGKKTTPTSSPILVGLTLEGDVDSMGQFLHEIERKLPLAEVKNVSFSDKKGEVLLAFYMKALPNLQINYSDPLTTVSESDRTILNGLHQWASQ